MEGTILGLVLDILKKNIFDERAIFVFPTDVAAFSWAAWAVKNTGRKATERERFLAWDSFKSQINEKSDKNPIPAFLRKIFATNLMEENARTPFLESIISPAFAKDSLAFSSWISSILPKLGAWHKKIARADRSNPCNSFEFDAENRDYRTLFEKYSAFLLKNNLFEPSWEAKLLFSDAKIYFVFFPEILEDYCDYEEFFEGEKKLKNITIFHAFDEKKQIFADFFSNAKTEFRKTALSIRALHEEKKVPWNDIAISAPDLQTLLPYIERELRLCGVPYVVRFGSSMTRGAAASFFKDALECLENDFSYISVRTLLLNQFVPWKDERLNEQLVREGVMRKCLCRFDEKIDIWEESLCAKESFDTCERERNLYKTLKAKIKAFGRAKTFFAVRKAWGECKRDLFCAEKFSEDVAANKIFGRCLSVLNNLVKIEEDFKVSVSNPFKFWVEELEDATYQEQQEEAGVSVFAYKVSASAFFPYQFVVAASQKGLSMQNHALGFLTEQKRKALGILDRDFATAAFINLYAKTHAFFSCSENSVSGFAITHSRLSVKKDKDGKKIECDMSDVAHLDFEQQEKKFFVENSSFPKSVYEWQFSGAKNFCLLQKNPQKNSQPSFSVLEKIKEKFCKDGIAKIDASAMKNFFPCKRKWLLKCVLKPQEDSFSTRLFGPFDAGKIYHAVMEGRFRKFLKSGNPLPILGEDGLFENEMAEKKEMLEILNDVIAHFENVSENGEKISSPLQKQSLFSQAAQISVLMTEVFRAFCKADSFFDEEDFGGCKVFCVEEWLSKKNANIAECGDAPFLLFGKIDLVLQNPKTKGLCLVDYKRGWTPSAAQCVANISTENEKDGDLEKNAGAKLPELLFFQMPMYVTLLQDCENHPVERAAYFSMKKLAPSFVIKNPRLTKKGEKSKTDKSVSIEEFSITQKVFFQYVQRYAHAILFEKNFSPDEKVNFFSDCAACEFRAFCRTTYTGK